VISSSYDPARGQFSGGQIAATTRSGTSLFGGAFRLRLEPGLLPAGNAGGDDGYTVAEVGGGAGGALLPGRLFWFGAVQASRSSSTPATLATVPAAALAELGLSADSVSRFRAVTSGLGFTAGWQRPPPDALSRRAAGLARIDFHAARAHTLTLRLDARAAEARGLGASAFGVGGSDERVSRTSGGVLAQLASYLGSARNELRAYRTTEVRRQRGGAGLPGGFVDVLSDLGDGRSGVSQLSFGEGASPYVARATVAELADELLLRLRGDDHRLKLGFVLSRETARQQNLGDAGGTFGFRSLADLEQGHPASFTRTLGDRGRQASAEYGALFAAHLWHAAPRLWLIQGLRVEETRWPGTPVPAGPLRAAFGAADGALGSGLELSPRIGFAYETAARRWDLRGGVGRFVGTLPLSTLAEAFGEAGGTVSHLVCLGAAAPRPDWARYATDPGTVPSRCADGGGGSASAAPAATVFVPGFAPPSTWRASAGGGGALLQGRRGRLDLHLDALLIVGGREPLAVDRNLVPVPAFRLDGEGGRPVFAPARRIDATTGMIDPAAGRVLPEFASVREAAARGRSSVAQLTAGVTFLSSRFDLISAYYTHTRARDEVTGFRAPGGFAAPVAGGDPNAASRGPSDFQRRHSLQLQGIHPVGKAVEIGVIGRITSGAPFTPLADADVNGDGAANDAAFVFGAGADPELAGAMEALRLGAPARIRHCLERQSSRIAARNSCSGPWRATFDLQVNLPVERGTRPGRFTASLAVNNVPAALDRVLHGERGLRGWGDDGYADPTLLRVRGFDPARGAFLYTVNSSFGAGRLDPFRVPATLTLTGRVTLGSDPARQPMLAMTAGIRARGRTAEELGAEIAGRIPNTPRQVLGLADTLGLALTGEQRTALESQAERVGERLGPLTHRMAAELSVVERGGNDTLRTAARTHSRELAAEMQARLDEITEGVRAVLTPAQWSLLPDAVRRPARQLVPPRTLSAGAADTW
jgi:hypothetical protein